MLDSPIPFLIGVLGDSSTRFDNIQTNAVYYIDNRFEFVSYNYNSNELTKDNRAEPYLGSLKEMIETNLSMAKYYIQTNEVDKFENYCTRFYKSTYDCLRTKLADRILEVEVIY